MSLVIRYRCHGCGAFHDGARGPAWVRCAYCQALIGFDWLAWFESPDYAAWLKRSAECVFRPMRGTHSGPCGALVPKHAGRAFRWTGAPIPVKWGSARSAVPGL